MSTSTVVTHQIFTDLHLDTVPLMFSSSVREEPDLPCFKYPWIRLERTVCQVALLLITNSEVHFYSLKIVRLLLSASMYLTDFADISCRAFWQCSSVEAWCPQKSLFILALLRSFGLSTTDTHWAFKSILSEQFFIF